LLSTDDGGNLAAAETRPRAATVKFDKAAMANAKTPAQSSHMLKTGRRGNPFCKVRRVFR
jgi:hypothetical protein